MLSNHTEVHPPLTVMPGQAVHPLHLHHQVQHGRHHHPFDNLVPRTGRTSSSPPGSLRIRKLSKTLMIVNDKDGPAKVTNTDTDIVVEIDRKKEEIQSKAMKQEDEENLRKPMKSKSMFGSQEDTNIPTNLLASRSETSPGAIKCSSLISVGFCGPGASSSSSGGSRASLRTPGGRGRAKGALGDFLL